MSTSTDLRDLVAHVFAEMGGVGSLADVRDQVIAILPPDAIDHLIRKGLTSAIGGYFRKQGADGLPTAPEVDEHGTHMLLELTTVEEYRYLIRKYMSRSTANRSAALRAAERCHATFGVLIDVDRPDSQISRTLAVR